MKQEKIYYTIRDIKQTKYGSLEQAMQVCEKQNADKMVIEKHIEIVEEIPYAIKRKCNDINLIKELLHKVKTCLCNPELNLYENGLNVCHGYIDEDFFRYAYSSKQIDNYEWRHHTLDEKKIVSKIYQKYISDLFEVYPIDKVQISMLKTNYKACNGIQIYFKDCWDYIKSGYTFKTNDIDLFPRNFCIQLRGDDKRDINISMDSHKGNHGRNVNDFGEEFVDLSSTKIQNYVDTVLAIFHK